MGRMKWLALMGPAVLSGCFLFGSGESSRVETTDEKLRREKLTVPSTVDLHAFGPVSGCQVGRWATYTIVKDGGTQSLTLAVVDREGEYLWIEVIEEGDVRRASARRVGPDGLVDLAYYREIPVKGAPSSVHLQPITQYSETARPPMEVRNRESRDEELTVGGNTLSARMVRIEFEDINGLRVTEQTWWSKSVPPLYSGSEEGGLVRKVAPGLTVDLTAFGDGAKPVIEIPKK